jgi:anti-sigma-K factor RskA
MAQIHPDDLLAAYALDALPEEERLGVQAHLAECAQCRRWVARFGRSTEVLTLAVPEYPPPSVDLRDRILRAAERTEQVRNPRAPVAVARRPSSWLRLGGWLAAAVLFLTSLGVGVWNYTLQQRISALEQPPALGGALLATADAAGAAGSFAATSDRMEIVRVDNLPPPAAGLVYEAWIIGANGPRPAGTFLTTPDGHGAVVLTGTPTVGDVIAITAERSPGTSAPAGKVLLKGTARPSGT